MTMSSRLCAVLLSLLSFPAVAAQDCELPEDLIPEQTYLPNTAAALSARQPLTIVALGTASTAGTGLANANMAFPFRLAERLREAYPSAPIKVVNKGRMGETTRTMADIMKPKVLPEHPSLVLWEAGSVEAVNGSDPYLLASDIGRGIDILRAAKADVILIDMQYSPAAAALINFPPYLEAMRITAEHAQVPLFRRYAAMRAWTEAGIIDLDGDPVEQRAIQANRAGNCVANALAVMIGKTILRSPNARP